MTICDDCTKEYSTVSTCTFPYVSIDGKVYCRNSLYEPGKIFVQEIRPQGVGCEECGVDAGALHHFGCSAEICPVCKESLPTCECDNVITLKDRHA